MIRRESQKDFTHGLVAIASLAERSQAGLKILKFEKWEMEERAPNLFFFRLPFRVFRFFEKLYLSTLTMKKWKEMGRY